MEPSDRVLVLNAGYEPLHRVTLKHSIRMLVRGVAEIVHVPDQTQNARARVGSEGFVLDLLDRCAGGTAVPAAPRKALDAVTAAAPYCGGPAQTVDHVLPKSRGGGSTGCFFQRSEVASQPAA
jgi:hypothetical protein